MDHGYPLSLFLLVYRSFATCPVQHIIPTTQLSRFLSLHQFPFYYAIWGTTIPPVDPPSSTDKAGHGTHNAGTVGGTRCGIAKKRNHLAVKVLGDDGPGAISSVTTSFQNL